MERYTVLTTATRPSMGPYQPLVCIGGPSTHSTTAPRDEAISVASVASRRHSAQKANVSLGTTRPSGPTHWGSNLKFPQHDSSTTTSGSKVVTSCCSEVSHAPPCDINDCPPPPITADEVPWGLRRAASVGNTCCISESPMNSTRDGGARGGDGAAATAAALA